RSESNAMRSIIRAPSRPRRRVRPRRGHVSIILYAESTYSPDSSHALIKADKATDDRIPPVARFCLERRHFQSALTQTGFPDPRTDAIGTGSAQSIGTSGTSLHYVVVPSPIGVFTLPAASHIRRINRPDT